MHITPVRLPSTPGRERVCVCMLAHATRWLQVYFRRCGWSRARTSEAVNSIA